MPPCRRARAWPGLVLLAAAGCGGGPKMAAVQGRVTYPDGAPVAGGKVVLLPADDPTWPSAVGDIQADGAYVISTEAYRDGARLGRYRVSVQPPQDDYNSRKPPPIDPRFADVKTSGFAVTVEDRTNVLDLTVTRPEPKK